MTDEIYLLNDEHLTSLPARTFREGIRGERLERALQKLLEDHPRLVPGAQIDVGGGNPPEFATLASEVQIGSWSLDILMTDQFAMPTLVETKLSENPEARRAVIGQIIEYAASAMEALGSGDARSQTVRFWEKRPIRPEFIAEILDTGPQSDEFWDRFEKNLQDGHMRLIVAADQIRPEVRKMIEFLNQEMANIEVLGLEIRSYASEDSSMVMVPRLIGQTVKAAERRGSGGAILWGDQQLREVLAGIDDQKGAKNFERLLDWAMKNGRFAKSHRKHPGFLVNSSANIALISVSLDSVYIWFRQNRFLGGNEQRQEVIGRLKALGMVAEDVNPDDVADGRYSLRLIPDLSDDELGQLFGILASA